MEMYTIVVLWKIENSYPNTRQLFAYVVWITLANHFVLCRSGKLLCRYYSENTRWSTQADITITLATHIYLKHRELSDTGTG